MTEVLFCLSVGFVAYVVYVLVDEQKPLNLTVPETQVITVKPSRTKKMHNTAASAKAKPKSANNKKSAAKSAGATSDAILSYLGKNGLTTVAKLSRDLPDGRKVIQDTIDRLIQENVLTHTLIRRAQAVALKG
jgi:predicted HTH transcriptional regulator